MNRGDTNTNSSDRPNTIGLRQKELNMLFDAMDRRSMVGAAARAHARWPFRHTSVSVTIAHPGGSTAELRLACRNLSATGVGFLHSGFIYTGSKVMVHLPVGDATRTVPGQLVRCDHIRGVVHEIGVRFDEPIDLREVVQPDPLEQCFSLERVDPASLRGVLIYAEASGMDQRIVGHYLRETGVRLRTADSCEKAMALAKQGCDLLLVDTTLPDGSGTDLVHMVRAEGVSAPVIMVSAAAAGAIRDEIRAAKASAFLAKPFDQTTLLRALAEFLTDAGPQDDPKLAVAGEDLRAMFSQQLSGYADRVEKAAAENEAMEVYVLAVQLKGLAPAMGLSKLADKAERVAASLSANMNLDIVAMQIRDLAAECRAGRQAA